MVCVFFCCWLDIDVTAAAAAVVVFGYFSLTESQSYTEGWSDGYRLQL